MYYVYILKSPKQFYIGYTSDLKRRFKEHIDDKSLSTRYRGPWTLVYYEACLSNKDALHREKYLKTAWGRRYIKQRIRNSA